MGIKGVDYGPKWELPPLYWVDGSFDLLVNLKTGALVLRIDGQESFCVNAKKIIQNGEVSGLECRPNFDASFVQNYERSMILGFSIAGEESGHDVCITPERLKDKRMHVLVSPYKVNIVVDDTTFVILTHVLNKDRSVVLLKGIQAN